jgi:nanoRNase/pAp phosphatase (c-di-AMP/oligoRNAs hydrolase)
MKVVTTHRNTDLDGLASVVAGTLLYPDTVPVLSKQINPNVNFFLTAHKRMLDIKTADEIDLEKVTELIVVDTNQWKRLDGLGKLQGKQDLTIHLWDHHSAIGNIDASWKRQETLGANITAMTEEIKIRKITISPMAATLFLAGIYEDTGNLTFSSTTPRDVYAAGYLLECKADLDIVASLMGSVLYSRNQKKILFEMLQNVKTVNMNGYSISINIQPIDGHVDTLAQVVQKYAETIGVDAAFGIFPQKNDRCIVIGRSKRDGPDMSVIMSRLGGGGHPSAGSAMLKSVPPKSIEKLILDLIENHNQSSIRISDLMSFPVLAVSPDLKMETLRKLLRENNFKGAPVIDDGKLVGMITRTHFKKLKRDDQWEAPVKAFMARDIVTIEPGMSPMQAVRKIITKKVGHLPVIENGQVIGMVTRSDLMVYFYDQLPK